MIDSLPSYSGPYLVLPAWLIPLMRSQYGDSVTYIEQKMIPRERV
jgi:hypothetical protein